MIINDITIRKNENNKKKEIVRIKINSDHRFLYFRLTIYKDNGVVKRITYRRTPSKEFESDIRLEVIRVLQELESISKENTEKLN